MAANRSSQLNNAVKSLSIERVQQLLKEGADVNAKVDYGWTPLLTAVQADNEEMVQLLLDHGAEPCLRKANGATPLILAGIVGNVKLLELFLSKGSDINECDDNGFTAFMEAAWHDKEEALRYLYEKGADVNLRRVVNQEKRTLNKGGKTALMDAASRGHLSIVKALVEDMKADVNICDNWNKNALLYACSSESDDLKTRESVAHFLLEHGADVTRRNEKDKTTLILATEMKSQSLVKALLEKEEIDINYTDATGKTALTIAVENNNVEIAQLLCEKGARTDTGDLINIATRNYNNKMAALLRQYDAMAIPKELPDWTPTSKRWGEQLKKLYTMYRPMIRKLKIFTDPNYKIGNTSQGGIYLGLYDGKEVAVKRFLACTKSAEQEKKCLEKCHARNNLVMLLGTEVDKGCLYLCLSLCEKNLEEYVSAPENEISCKRILYTIFEAVEELHASGFGHQDLHPRNILIDADGKIHLADFDKTEELTEGESNLIRKDMEALGRLVLYLAAKGKVVFEETDIKDLVMCPDNMNYYEETVDLIKNLVSPVGRTLGNLKQHPFFWSTPIKYRFLRDVGNEEDIKVRNTKHENKQSKIVKILNHDPDPFHDWTKEIDKQVLDSMDRSKNKKKNKNKNENRNETNNTNDKKNKNRNENETETRSVNEYYENCTTDLLKFIRNMGEHFEEKDEKVKEIIKEPAEYFTKCFPKLIVHVYNILHAPEGIEVCTNVVWRRGSSFC
ncbi:2-5A-dependent ribonuclease [Alligator mississippiensis]|uniref:2-5A-dependent ribonuclease n=1 Tax=Alligator mississippiensis TaxID=8496 RepID=A0A151MI88_ALLMI|nr:2-5A-dependent ribonuclease [Alligator mississippiensis]